ncbi:MAG: DUF6788 family protein [Chloroflexota bacterium]
MKRELKAEMLAMAKAQRLLAQAHDLGLLLKASVVHRRFRCGKPNCHCAEGKPHQDLIVCRKVQGKKQTIRVRTGREPEALQWQKNWRRFNHIVEKLTTEEIRILCIPKDATRRKRR